MNLHRILLAALTAAVTVTTAACGVVGDGNKPESASIRLASGGTDITAAKAFVCIAEPLAFVVTFTDGGLGNYTNEARWTSSNPAVAQVSNLDIQVPGQAANTFYSRGVVVPQAAGTATITGEYLTFKQSVEVTVGNLANLRTLPGELNLAPGSIGDLAAVADLDGVTTAVDASVSWAFVTPNIAVAGIDSVSGLVTAVAAGDLTARGTIVGCALTADAPVSVSPLQSLALTKEFSDRSTLVVGTTESLTSIGTLASGKTQDLSTQIILTSTDSTSVAPLSGSLGYVLAVKSATVPVGITASFGSPAVSSSAVQITPVDATLARISLAPATASASPNGFVRFVATGEFANGLLQPVTRHVTFASSNAAAVSVGTTTVITPTASGSINPISGVAVVAGNTAAGTSVTITATNSAATLQPSATATLTVTAR